MAVTHQTSLDPAAEDFAHLTTVRVEILTLVDELADLNDTVTELLTARPQTGLGFLSFDRRTRLDDERRSERADHRADAYLTGTAAPTKPSPAPGDLTVIEARVVMAGAVHDACRRITRRLLAAEQTCTIIRIPQTATFTRRLEHLAELARTTTHTPTLTRVLADLQNAERAARTAIDGNPRTLLDEPCPHCGRRTLLVDFNNDLITCDVDHTTGRHHRCECTTSSCACHYDPTHRHTWHRVRGNGWLLLAGDFQRRREKPTPAADLSPEPPEPTP